MCINYSFEWGLCLNEEWAQVLLIWTIIHFPLYKIKSFFFLDYSNSYLYSVARSLNVFDESKFNFIRTLRANYSCYNNIEFVLVVEINCIKIYQTSERVSSPGTKMSIFLVIKSTGCADLIQTWKYPIPIAICRTVHRHWNNDHWSF